MRFNIFSLRPPRFEQRSLDDDDDDEKNKNFNFGGERVRISYISWNISTVKKKEEKKARCFLSLHGA